MNMQSEMSSPLPVAGNFKCLVVAAFIAVFLFVTPLNSLAEPVAEPSAKERCPVCGMFVAKYEDWLSQVRLADNSVRFFDGVKDMLVYYHNSQYYKTQASEIVEVWIKDYYTLDWFDAKEAWYVTGSDVYGPMGHEFIPFTKEKAARNFLKDHKGKQILRFNDITDALVQSMRVGQKMTN